VKEDWTMLATLGTLRRLVTPFNVFAALVAAAGLGLLIVRFTLGLGGMTNLSDVNPWGIWIGFDVLCGVALAAGGFTLATTVHIFRLERYAPIVRSAVLTGFLGYFLVVVGLCFDLGRPWRLPNPILGNFGVTSVMFEVGWCVMLYLTVLFLEVSPAILEWLGWARVRSWSMKLTILLGVSGMVLSTLHQSSLGSLFLIAPGRLHPLWYSPYLPVFFFVSAAAAGLSMVIVEGALSHRFLHDRIAPVARENFDSLTLGLGKAASVVLFAYLGIKVVGLAAGNHWDLLATPYGHLFLVEMLGFVALPCALFAWGYRNQRVGTVRAAAALTVMGIVVNRLNVGVIALGWQTRPAYVPSVGEVATSVVIVMAGVLLFTWIVRRMPILNEHAAYKWQH
jgi:Ni/Fe-hydrogenase subunit HybB-like protein